MTYNSEVLAQHGWYVSPGVQIGIDSNGDLHRAAQITLGILTEEYPFTTGLTIGYKWFRQFDNSNEVNPPNDLLGTKFAGKDILSEYSQVAIDSSRQLPILNRTEE